MYKIKNNYMIAQKNIFKTAINCKNLPIQETSGRVKPTISMFKT